MKCKKTLALLLTMCLLMSHTALAAVSDRPASNDPPSEINTSDPSEPSRSLGADSESLETPNTAELDIGAGQMPDVIRRPNPMLSELPLGNLVSADENGNITLPDGLTAFDFYFPVFINDTLITTIADGAFQGCPYFNSVTIPTSITEIGANAFADCPSLSYIILEDRVDTEDILLGANWCGTAQVIFGVIEEIKDKDGVYDITEDTELKPIDPDNPSNGSDVYSNSPDTDINPYVIAPDTTINPYIITPDTSVTPILPEHSSDPSDTYNVGADTKVTRLIPVSSEAFERITQNNHFDAAMSSETFSRAILNIRNFAPTLTAPPGAQKQF